MSSDIPIPISISLFLFALTLTLTSAQKPSPGLTRDFCPTSDACQQPRKCYLLNNATRLPSNIPCPRFDACRCAPRSYIHCDQSSTCEDAEICARTLLFPFVCTSTAHVDSLKEQVVSVEDSRSDPLVPSCAPPSKPLKGAPPNGLVFDPCLPGTCADGLSCVFSRGNGKFQCCSDGKCVCHAPDTRPVCEFSTDCNQGEVCGVGATLPQQCYSRKWLRNRPALWSSLKKITASPTPTPDSADPAKPGPGDTPATGEPGDSADAGDEAGPEEDVCVDAEALRHMSRHELVFEKDRLGRVLCDISGSCATAGHIVKFEGTPMMMRSYCDVVGCIERIMRVNSVRYRRGLVTRSKTHALQYTAFAARYATRAEEGVLAAAVRVGL